MQQRSFLVLYMILQIPSLMRFLLFKIVFSHLVKSQNTLLKNTATGLQTKFEKYWGEGDKINLLLYVVVIQKRERCVQPIERFKQHIPHVHYQKTQHKL